MSESVKRHPKMRRRRRAHMAVAMLECWWGPIREVEAIKEPGDCDRSEGDATRSIFSVSCKADEAVAALLLLYLSESLRA